MAFVKYSSPATTTSPTVVEWSGQSVSITEDEHTPFKELLVAQRVSRLNLKPTWGVDNLRDSTSTGTGSTIAETNGEIKLSTGTNAAGECTLETKERGQYQAGAVGEVGTGIRIPTSPTGDSYAEWGYFDDNNGFGWGVDSSGVYTFRLTGGTQTKRYQSAWSVNTLSDLNLDEGNIFQIKFTWYGYGEVQFIVNATDSSTGTQTSILVDRLSIDNEASIIDPNQPIRVYATNGGSSTTNLDVYVGGRQFSFIGGVSEPQKRNTPAEIQGVSITSSVTYEPKLALRKKATFNGRDNSVKASFASIQIGADQKVYWKLTYGDTLDGSWGAITDVPAASTALEVNTTATSGGSTINRVIDRGFVLGTRSSGKSDDREIRIPLGSTDPVTLWIKNGGTNATVEAVVNVEEEW